MKRKTKKKAAIRIALTILLMYLAVIVISAIVLMTSECGSKYRYIPEEVTVAYRDVPHTTIVRTSKGGLIEFGDKSLYKNSSEGDEITIYRVYMKNSNTGIYEDTKTWSIHN